MGLFKSKQQKDMEQRMLIKKTMQRIQRYIKGLEIQKNKYIEGAKKAKANGSQSQYNLAAQGLKMAISQQKKAEEILLNFELTSQMKDLNIMTSEFLNGMSVLSREMSKISKNMDFIKVQKEFEGAMMGVEETTLNLDQMLSDNEASFDNIAMESNAVEDKEIEALIDNEVAGENTELDQDINKRLEEVKSSLKQN